MADTAALVAAMQTGVERVMVAWGGQVDMVVGDEVRSGAPLIITKGEHCGMVISEQLLPIVQVGKFQNYEMDMQKGGYQFCVSD